MDKDERQAVRKLSGIGRVAYEFLLEQEKVGLVGIPGLCQALSHQPLHFVTFSCLAVLKGKEELRLELDETFFFKKFRKKSVGFFDALRSCGLDYRFTIILPDMEPRRTWGWDVSQEELTVSCQLMAEESLAQLPDFWEIAIWSEIERQSPLRYEEFLEWARTAPEARVLAWREGEHLARFPEIKTRHDRQSIGERQVAAYAFEGAILEQVYPRSIMLQSEFPADRKDQLYQTRRQTVFPIVHPFEL